MAGVGELDPSACQGVPQGGEGGKWEGTPHTFASLHQVMYIWTPSSWGVGHGQLTLYDKPHFLATSSKSAETRSTTANKTRVGRGYSKAGAELAYRSSIPLHPICTLAPRQERFLSLKSPG